MAVEWWWVEFSTGRERKEGKKRGKKEGERKKRRRERVEIDKRALSERGPGQMRRSAAECVRGRTVRSQKSEVRATTESTESTEAWTLALGALALDLDRK